MGVYKDLDENGRLKSWAYVIEIGEGARKRYRKRGFKTKALAESAYAKAKAERDAGDHVESSRETVGELLNRWLTTVARHKVRATTYQGYEATIRNHLVPEFGGIRVQKLTAARVQAYYSKRLDAGMGTRALQLAHLRLSQALDMAEREGVVRRNVCALVDTPTHRSKPGQAWTQEEANRFLEKARKHFLHPLWALELATGLRRGELIGLRWQDVDLDAGTLRVQQEIVIVYGKPVVSEPKTDSSRRKMRIPADVVQGLVAHRVVWEERRYRSASWQDGDLVFCTRDGKPLNPNNLYRYYNALIEAAGVPKIRLHDARHTHGTIMVAKGVSIRAVADRLGHSKTSVTLNTYAHVLPSMRDEALEAIEEALFRYPELGAGNGAESEATPTDSV